MTSNRRNSSVLGLTLLLFLGLCFAGSFVVAGIWGEQGSRHRATVQDENHRLQLQLDALDNQVAYLTNRTERLSDGSLDIDLLDEQLRRVLGLTRSDEILVP